MVVREVVAKSIVTKSTLPESDYCINPYVGCAHACAYCYARFMKRFTGHREPWGEFVDVKLNAVELVRRKVTRAKTPLKGVILLGSVTDAYQPLESKYKLTRGILEVLADEDCELSILTKSDLVVRDIDLLRRFSRCSVGLTLTTKDEDVRRRIEPRAAPTAKRIAALKELHRSGIDTYAFIGPIMPYFTELDHLLRDVQGIADSVWGEILNVRAGNWRSLCGVLDTYWPKMRADFERKARDSSYWDQVEAAFRRRATELGMPVVGFYRH